MPESTAADEASMPHTCALASHTTRCPARVNACIAIWLHIVPVGRKAAAALPVSSAARSCSRLTVGSSPYQSSPTSASAMARRMACDGLLTVSERRSMWASIGLASSGGHADGVAYVLSASHPRYVLPAGHTGPTDEKARRPPK